ENPIGLSPGEAACALMLEDPRAAETRGATPLAYLRSVATAREPKAFTENELSQGEALAAVITTVLSQAGSGVFSGSVVTDLNWEKWRADEFGCARVRVARDLWDGGELILPVGSTGDAGAATVGIQIAVACRSLARGYASGDAVLVTCSDERGAVGAAVFS